MVAFFHHHQNVAGLRQVFDGGKGHHVFGVPADAVRFLLVNFFPGVQVRGGNAAVVGKGNRVAAAVDIDLGVGTVPILGQLGSIPGGGLPAQGNGQGVGQHHQKQHHAGRNPFEPAVIAGREVGCQADGQRRQVGEGIGRVLGGHAFKEQEDAQGPDYQVSLPVLQTGPQGPVFQLLPQGPAVFL